MPIYKPTACLSASYEQDFTGHIVDTFVPARAIHQALYDDENLYRRLYADNPSPINSSKENLDIKCNIATAKITLLYSEDDVEHGLPESFETYALPVQFEADRHHVSFSMLNLYTTDPQNLNPEGPLILNDIFNQSVLNRLRLAKLAVPLATLTDAEKKFKQTDERILLNDFAQAFHHSEQALMTSLLSRANVRALVEALRNRQAATFGGMVLDMYSTRFMCNNCNYQLVGFANNGFMPVLMGEIAASELRMLYPDNRPFLHPRVSAEYTCTTNNGALIHAKQDRARSHRYDSTENTYLPLQSSVRKMRLNAYRGNDFATRSDFFLSGNLRNNAVDTAIINKRNAGLR